MSKRAMRTVLLLLAMTIFSATCSRADPTGRPKDYRRRQSSKVANWSNDQHGKVPWYRLGTHLSIALSAGSQRRQINARTKDAQRRDQKRQQWKSRYERLTYYQRVRPPAPPGWATSSAPWLKAIPASTGGGARVRVQHLRGSHTHRR